MVARLQFESEVIDHTCSLNHLESGSWAEYPEAGVVFLSWRAQPPARYNFRDLRPGTTHL
jgi:hypothetical protein